MEDLRVCSTAVCHQYGSERLSKNDDASKAWIRSRMFTSQYASLVHLLVGVEEEGVVA